MDYTFTQSMHLGNKTWNSGVRAKKLQNISENKVKGVNYTVKVIAREKNCVGKLQREWKGATSGEGSWVFPIGGELTSPYL